MYGMSEVGILRSRSRASDSLWVQVGGDGYETRVVNGMLQIRGRSTMLGYLNAPSPFTEDGWLMTGDAPAPGRPTCSTKTDSARSSRMRSS